MNLLDFCRSRCQGHDCCKVRSAELLEPMFLLNRLADFDNITCTHSVPGLESGLVRFPRSCGQSQGQIFRV